MVIFGELPDVLSSLGAGLIFASCIISAWGGTNAPLRLANPVRLANIA